MRPKNVRFVFLLLKTCLVFGLHLNAQNLVVIDPGHGGKDPGTLGQNHVLEKNIVLMVGEEMVLFNRTLFGNALDIYLTRYSDSLISLSDRTKLAYGLDSDLFISLQCNHSHNPSVKGYEVYVVNGDYEFSRESTYLAYELQQQFKEKLGFRSRGVKFANFQVLRETSGSMPSFLIELGFLSNVDESTYYQKSETFRALALVLWESLIKN